MILRVNNRCLLFTSQLVVLFILCGCSNKYYCEIHPVSPVKLEYFVNKDDKQQGQISVVRYFTLKSNLKSKQELDSVFQFAKKLLPNDVSKYSLYAYFFYKYEAGRLDEKFVNDSNTESKSIENVGQSLYLVQWNFGKLSYAIKYHKNGKTSLIDVNHFTK